MNLLEQYNARLRSLEDGTITMLHRVLDASFNRLVRRTRIHLRAGYTDPAQRNLALLQEFRQLIPAYRPDRVDAYDRVLRTLVQTSMRYGTDAADQLTRQMSPERDRLDTTLPLDATIAAVQQTRGYLRRHGETFAETASFTLAQGVAEGRPTAAMVEDMRQRLNVTKSRATTIVRTESLRAYNTASDRYYSAQGIDTVLYYATADDRTCPWCAPRAGRIYRRADIHVPLHPQCRCFLAPWDLNLEEIDPDYKELRRTHRAQVEEALRNSPPPEPVNLNRAAVFEQLAPTPLF